MDSCNKLWKLLVLLCIYKLKLTLQSTQICADYLVSGTQSVVTSDFPQEARLYNGIGWINTTIKVTLERVSKIKGIVTQGCDTDNVNGTLPYNIYFKTSTSSSWTHYAQNRNGVTGPKIYEGGADCVSLTTLSFSLKLIMIKIKPVNWNNTQSFRFDLLGCPDDTNEMTGSQRWMSSQILENINVTDGIIWNKHTGKLFLCSRECENDPICRSFVYSDNGACQGHSISFLTFESNYDRQSGLRYFIKNDNYIVDSRTAMLYKFYSIRLSITDANAYCKQENAELIIVDTDQKLQSLWNSANRNLILSQESNFHVSGSYSFSDGTWNYWTNISIPTSMWSTDFSYNNNNGCVVMTPSGLQASNCNDEHFFICQKI